MNTIKDLLKAGAGVACIAGLAVLLSPSEDAMDARHARYCLTATNTPDKPYTQEQCWLTQVYKLDVTEWDLIIYHYRKNFGHYPLGEPIEQDERMQVTLEAHYAAHPNEAGP